MSQHNKNLRALTTLQLLILEGMIIGFFFFGLSEDEVVSKMNNSLDDFKKD